VIRCISRRLERLETLTAASRRDPIAFRVLLVDPERGLTGVLVIEGDNRQRQLGRPPRRPIRAPYFDFQSKGRLIGLGGHLKTGHRRTLQNRPAALNQNKTICTVGEGARANIFCGTRPRRDYTDLIWAEGTATQGCDRSADSAAGMAGRRKPPLEAVILADRR
jgi:hypothetical protein